MIIVMEREATDVQVAAVEAKIRTHGLEVHVSRGTERTLIGAIGDERKLDPEMFEIDGRRREIDAHREAVQARRARMAQGEHGHRRRRRPDRRQDRCR